MARSHRSFPRGSCGTARLNQWVGPPDQGFVTVSSGGATLVSSLSPGEATTLVRTRGMVAVIPTTFASDQNINGAFGIGVISAEAFGIGITAIPSPFTDADWPGWLMWESFAFRVEFGDGTGVRAAAGVGLQMIVDSKGMRKAGSNEVYVFIAESRGGAYSIADNTRQLFKLS